MNKYKVLVPLVVLGLLSLGASGTASAQSQGQVNVNLPNDKVAGGTQVSVPVLLSDFSDTNLTVRLVANSGTFTISEPASLTLNDGYPSFVNQAEISFHGANADVVAALKDRVLWTSPGDALSSSNLSMRVEVTKYVFGTTYDPETGHTYVEIETTSTWHDALLAANAMTFDGKTGYLATITSQEENDFITSKTSGQEVWIGATDKKDFVNEALVASGQDPITNDSQQTGDFYWVSGPEMGTHFQTGLNSPTALNGSFISWYQGEPNNTTFFDPDGEACGVTNLRPGQWNDLNCGWKVGYLVEFSTGVEIFGTSVFTFDNISGQSQDIDLLKEDSGPTLANTGFDAWMIAGLALALIGVGTGLRVVARKK